MEQKKKRKFNVIDVIVVVLLAAALGLVGWKMTHRGSGVPNSTVHISYTVKCEGVDKSLYETCQEHLPSRLMASGELFDGQIQSVKQEPYLVLDGNGQWVEDPDHVNLCFDVECNVTRGTVLTTKVGDQEVRVGKSDYILKSEYIEFDKCVITAVTWDE